MESEKSNKIINSNIEEQSKNPNNSDGSPNYQSKKKTIFDDLENITDENERFWKTPSSNFIFR